MYFKRKIIFLSPVIKYFTFDLKSHYIPSPTPYNQQVGVSWLFWFGLVWFYSISPNFDYLKPNPVYTYIKYVWFENIFC